MDYKFVLFFCVIINSTLSTHIDLNWDPTRPAFDPEIYENALDSEICNEQLEHIRQNLVLRARILEAGMRLPKAILELNNVHLGNYDQCLGINQDIDTSVIEGKYCLLQVPINSNFMDVAKTMNWDLDPSLLSDDNLNTYKHIKELMLKIEDIRMGTHKTRTVVGDLSWLSFRIALCIPKACTTQEGISGLLFNVTALGFQYEEEFCRFKDDKPWVPVDYVAIAIFSLIGLLTVLSTAYDVGHTFVYKTDPKSVSSLCKSFSIYTNGKRLTTFTNNPNILTCVDGIRSISMFWIVVGHCYMLTPPQYNFRYVFMEYLPSLKSAWLFAAPFTVDTFFFLSGMLMVYTTVGKLSGAKLLKSLHLFYLNRILRMFPLLATLVLLQASILHKISDGPIWTTNALNTDRCRTYWWATLLYIQNYVNPENQCILHSWYLAIDMQCYIISPIVLYWVLSKKKKQAWSALTIGVLVSLTVTTIYCFIMKFPGWTLAPVREGGTAEYQVYYYFNTITRAPPFFVGMVFGYLLNIWKGRQPQIPYYVNALLWLLSGSTMLTLMYTTHLIKSTVWDKWIVDDLLNSFGRSLWGLSIGWIIFACQHGYGGPINWFLSLDIWKLPSRISYGIYLFHYHMQFIIYERARQPIFFSDALAMYNFFAQVLITYGIAFSLTLLIDSPSSVLIKFALGDGIKKPPKKDVNQ